MAGNMMNLALHDLGSRMVAVGTRLLSAVESGGAASGRAIMDVVGGEGDQQECVICLVEEEDQKAARWKEMPCGHRFHGGCLEQWLRVRGTCPVCRRPLSPPGLTRAQLMELRNNWSVSAQRFQELVAYRRTRQ